MILSAAERFQTFDIRKKLGFSGGYGRLRYGIARFGYYKLQAGIWQMRQTLQGKIPVNMRFYRPTNPQTMTQEANRAKFSAAMSAWQSLTDSEKEAYNVRAKKRGWFGRNLYIREYYQSN